MRDALSLFRFLRDAQSRGEATLLTTITAVQGSSARRPGYHMAVSETGATCGSLSGGCVEAGVVGEALRVLRAGQPETMRFGAGSPLIDIRLPCGGGMDLHFAPHPDPALVTAVIEGLAARRPVGLAIDRADGGLSLHGTARNAPDNPLLILRHDPDLRLIVAGHGDEVIALTRLARAFGAEVDVLSPDAAVADAARQLGASTTLLRTATSPGLPQADPYTAIIFLFHDHDWETELLGQALAMDPLLVGAMGSRATHDQRKARLHERGIASHRVETLVGPIGLIPASRDPNTLAVSILAQAVDRHTAFCGR